MERVKKLIERCDKCDLKQCENCEISWSEVQALKNLLKAYKEDEEKLKHIKQDLELLRTKLFENGFYRIWR